MRQLMADEAAAACSSESESETESDSVGSEEAPDELLDDWLFVDAASMAQERERLHGAALECKNSNVKMWW